MKPFDAMIRCVRGNTGQIFSMDEDGFDCVLVLGRYRFRVRVSWGEGWEHVSVSIPGEKHCPTWDQMGWIKDMFWHGHETVMQLHPADSDRVNDHPYCLHLWRPIDREIPVPPPSLVGVVRKHRQG